ncbi:MAG TPA: GntR family transcriptional regulator [Vicinamibacterales bacterium]
MAKGTPKGSPADGTSQVERAYRDIKAGIISGRYAPGAALSEVALAAEHGMSRTPIREGLSRLWTEHYLDRVAGHGYFVARVTLQSINDTFEVRRLLEGAAAAAAATLATDAEIEQLRTLANFPIVDGDYRAGEAANARFHLAVAAAAKNRLASELIERCLAQVDRFMSLGVSFGPFQSKATAAHLEIVDAIAARDPERARRRMEEHLDVGSRGMKAALAEPGPSTIGLI